MHVVEVTDGGVAAYVRDVTREQLRRGHQVHILAPAGFSDVPGARLHPWLVSRKAPTGLPKAARRIRKLVGSTEPDVLHLHSFFPGLLGRLLPVPGPRVIYQPHAWAFNAVRSAWLRSRIVTWERLATRRTHAIAGVSRQEIIEGFQHGIRAPIAVTSVPVDTDRFYPVDGTAQTMWRRQLRIKRNLIVCVGRICRQKGQDRLLDAWAHAPIPDTDLVLVGPGDTTPIRELAGDQWQRTVHAVGACDDVRPWLWAADLVVQPSRYEGLSVAAGEALACGRPLVSTDVNGARDAIGEGDKEAAGCVVPQADEEAGVVEACLRRISTPAMLERESQNARQRAVGLFSPSAVVDQLEGLYGAVPLRVAAAGAFR